MCVCICPQTALKSKFAFLLIYIIFRYHMLWIIFTNKSYLKHRKIWHCTCSGRYQVSGRKIVMSWHPENNRKINNYKYFVRFAQIITFSFFCMRQKSLVGGKNCNWFSSNCQVKKRGYRGHFKIVGERFQQKKNGVRGGG